MENTACQASSSRQTKIATSMHIEMFIYINEIDGSLNISVHINMNING